MHLRREDAFALPLRKVFALHKPNLSEHIIEVVVSSNTFNEDVYVISKKKSMDTNIIDTSWIGYEYL